MSEKGVFERLRYRIAWAIMPASKSEVSYHMDNLRRQGMDSDTIFITVDVITVCLELGLWERVFGDDDVWGQVFGGDRDEL